MQVEATFTDLAKRHARAAHEPLVAGPLFAARLREERLRRARVRRRRPRAARRRGRIRTGGTSPATAARVTVRYKVFGDRVDGTYLAVDTTHAHINMPAAIMWAHGLDDRPVDRHASSSRPACSWQVATQLHPGSTPLEFTAPNLQYLMDSPSEFGPIAIRQFTVGARTFRFALHHTGTDAELDGFVKDVEKIVRAGRRDLRRVSRHTSRAHYTFLADYLPYANGDGMEHRNSTVITVRRSRSPRRATICSTRSRTSSSIAGTSSASGRRASSRSISIARTCPASCGSPKGFTQYYGPLVLQRAGLVDVASTARTLDRPDRSGGERSGRLVRSAEEMSRMAPFIDGGRSIDRTNWSTTVISYYTVRRRDRAGARPDAARSHATAASSLDDFMRAMWRTYGKPGGSREGYVDHPYTIADAEATLARGQRRPAFARDFFARYIQGHEVADYRAPARARRLHAAQAQSRPRLARRSAPRVARRLARRRAGRADLADLRGRPRSGRRAAADRRPADRRRRRRRDGDAAAQARRHGAGRVRRSHGRRENGDRHARRGSAYRGRAGRRGRAHRRAEGLPRSLAGSRSRCLVPWLQLVDAALGVANFARGRKAPSPPPDEQSLQLEGGSRARRRASRPGSPASSSPR